MTTLHAPAGPRAPFARTRRIFANLILVMVLISVLFAIVTALMEGGSFGNPTTTTANQIQTTTPGSGGPTPSPGSQPLGSLGDTNAVATVLPSAVVIVPTQGAVTVQPISQEMAAVISAQTRYTPADGIPCGPKDSRQACLDWYNKDAPSPVPTATAIPPEPTATLGIVQQVIANVQDVIEPQPLQVNPPAPTYNPVRATMEGPITAVPLSAEQRAVMEQRSYYTPPDGIPCRPRDSRPVCINHANPQP